MNFTYTQNTETINILRAKLYQKLSAPLDAMLEQLYIASFQHYFIENTNKTLGFCCINSEAYLVQMFLSEEHHCKMEQAALFLNTIRWLEKLE